MKYLLNARGELVKLKDGLTTNQTKWTGQAETPLTIQAIITAIDGKEAELNALEYQLTIKLGECRDLKKSSQLVIDTITSKAIGFHKEHPAELQSYGIPVPTPREKKPVPSAHLVPYLKDDDDGVGYKVSTQVDPNCDVYEWERGIATDPSDVNTVPTMAFYKQTTKTNFLDDNVDKGVRYFYRVRATNATGNGPWSATANRIQ